MELRQSFQHRGLSKAAVVGISLLGLLSLAACGGTASGRKVSAPASGSAGAPAGAPTGTSTGAPADKPVGAPASAQASAPAAAAAPILHAGDFVLTQGPETAGFILDTSPDKQANPQIAESKIASCLGVPLADIQDHATEMTDGPYFSSTDGLTTVASQAEIAPAADVTRDAAILTRAQAPTCFGQLFFQSFQEGVATTGAHATLNSTRSLTPPTGATGAIRMSVTVTANGKRVPVTIDIIIIMSGRVESSLLVIQVNGLPDPTREQNLTRQVAGKVARQSGLTAA